MKVILWFSWVSLAFAAQDSASSRSSSSSSLASASNSTSSSTPTTQQSSSRNAESVILNALGDITTSSASTSSAMRSASASASVSASLSAIVLSTGIANTTAISATPTPTTKATYVNPWQGNFSFPAPTGTGSEYALQCQNAYFSFTSINEDFITATIIKFNMTSVIRSATVTEVHTLYTTSYYTLCDGHPRVITSAPTSESTEILLPSTTTILAGQLSQATYPDPNCTVSWNDCQGLWSQYASASSVYKSVSFEKANTIVSLAKAGNFWAVNGVTTTFPTPFPNTISLADEEISKYFRGSNYIIVTTPPPGGLFIFDGYTMTPGGPPVTIEHPVSFTNSPYTPHCRTEKPTCTANQRCEIGGDRVEIFWFPPQTNVTRDMCATAPAQGAITSRPPTNFTWTPISTGPYAVLPGNTTWFSGNVYVSLNRIQAHCTWSGTDVAVGGEHGGKILTMAPSELFSQRAIPYNSGRFSGVGWEFEPHAYSFNLNDLIEPYPWSAWNAQPECVMKRCTSINGAYNPWIAVPEAIRRLDPQWATCDLALYGLYDPPRALTSVGNLFQTTTVDEPFPGPTPGPTPPQTQVQPTNVPPKPSKPIENPDPNPGPNSNPPVPVETDGPARPNPPNPQNPQDPQNPGPPNPQDPARPPSPQPPTPITLTLPNGALITATPVPNPNNPGQNPSQPPDPTLIISGTTLSPSSPALTLTLPNSTGGTGKATPITLSLLPSSSGVVVIINDDASHSSTTTLALPTITPSPPPFSQSTAVITISGKTYTATSSQGSGSIVISELGLTLSVGGPGSTVDGTFVSAGSTGVVVGGGTGETTTTENFGAVATTTDGMATRTGGGVAEFTGGGAGAAAVPDVWGGEGKGKAWWWMWVLWFGGVVFV